MKTIALAAFAIAGTGWGLSSYLKQETHEIDRTVEASSEGMVVVRISEGDITIEGWRLNEVQVEGTIAESPERLEIEHGSGLTEIRLEQERKNTGEGTSLTIRVPRGSSLDVETAGAHTTASGVRGMVRLESEAGDLAVSGNPMGVIARSQSGDIDIPTSSTRGFAHSEEGTVRLPGGDGDTWQSDTRREAARWSERGRDYGEQYRELGSRIQAMVERAMRDVDVDGHFDLDRFADGFDVDMAASVRYDPEDMAELMDDLQEMFVEMEGELGEGMTALSEELEELGEEMKRRAAERR